jgi:hypothetical protein
MGELEILKKGFWDHTKIVIHSDKQEAFRNLENAEIGENGVEIKAFDLNKTLREIVEIAKEQNVNISDIRTLRPTLDDIIRERLKHV